MEAREWALNRNVAGNTENSFFFSLSPKNLMIMDHAHFNWTNEGLRKMLNISLLDIYKQQKANEESKEEIKSFE